MDKILVAVFDNETDAYQGLRALKDLHSIGDITLYSSAVIARDKVGKIDIKQEAGPGPLGTAVGLATGSLVGLLGGPVGLAMGASVGGFSGLLFDLGHAGVDGTFLDDVSKTLTAGKAAVVAEVDESWTTPVDVRLREYGGKVSRHLRSDVVEDQFVRDTTALEASLDALDDELDHASAENRAAVQKDIDTVKKQLKQAQAQAKAKLDQANAESQARIKTLQDQAKGASDRAKARIEKRISAAKADFDVRSKKLNQAWKIIQEALAA